MTARKFIPFNPLEKRHLAESVGQALLRQDAVSMAKLTAFEGAGIYTIYYTGKFPSYEPIAERNRHGKYRVPIYVGKAVPKGTRKGGSLETRAGKVMHNRLMQHANSLNEASNLEIQDFFCRFLLVDDIWIPLGESLLIARFSPIWNKLIDGFGNHDPGKGRHAGRCPRWDVLHPGRSWAERCQPRSETATQIAGEVEDFLRNNPPPEDHTLITN